VSSPVGYSPNQRLNHWFSQHLCILEADKPVLVSAALQDFLRIGQSRPVVKGKSNAVRGGGQRDDAVRSSFGRTVADGKEIAVVINLFDGGRESSANRSAERA